MKRKARAAGPLPVSPELRAALVAIRRDAKIGRAPEVELRAVTDLETHLAGAIPNDLLVTFLATGRSLGELLPLTRSIGEFYDAMNQPNWEKRFKFAHVVFDDTYNPDEGPLCCPLGNGAPATIVHWFTRKGESWKPTFLDPATSPFVAYCHWKYPDVDFTAKVSPADLQAFVPALAKPTAATLRRVKHPKFGEGVVKSALDGKLEIDFGAGGVRKLLASTVEDV